MTTDAKQQTRILVQAAVQACEDKKGEDTRILELDPIDSGLSDFFLVTSATNDRQAIAIADEVEHRLKKEFGIYAHSVEGRRQGEWILLDYVDFVVHVFLTERRAFYDIERLRKSARPLTPAEFDAELKTALAAKTRAARIKAPAAQPTVKKAAVKKSAAKKAAKPAAALPTVKKTAAKKTVAKPAIKKSVGKKAASKKPTAKKTPAKTAKVATRPAAKKAASKPAPIAKPKKAAKKSTTVRKPAANKVAVKKSPAKKQATKKLPAKKSSSAKKKK